MTVQERYLDVHRRDPSPELYEVVISTLIHPTYSQTGRVTQVKESLSIGKHQHSPRLVKQITSRLVRQHLQTGRLLGASGSFISKVVYQTPRLVMGEAAYNIIYYQTGRVGKIDALWLNTLYYHTSRTVQVSAQHTGTTGSQVNPTPIYYKTPRFQSLILKGSGLRYFQTARIAKVLTRSLGTLYFQTPRLITAVVSDLLLRHEQSGRIRDVIVQRLTGKYNQTGRLQECFISFQGRLYRQTPRVNSLIVQETPAGKIFHFSGRLNTLLSSSIHIQVSPNVIIYKDPMGDVQYYWVGWPGTDASPAHKTRGRDASYYLTISLWKTPKESSKSIEVWYVRTPVIQWNNNRVLEVNAESATLFDLTSQILPELGVYIPILKDWLRAWYHSYRSGEYQAVGNIVSAGYHWNKYRECKDLYEKALKKLQVLDTFARSAPRGTTIRPFRL